MTLQGMADPFFREAGAGPGVVCIHANAGSSSQWRALMERMAPRFRVLAPDTYGAGKGPPWPARGHLKLADEVAWLEPVFAQGGDPFTLIGHSYGGAIALLLYEPTLFALVDAAQPPPNDADGIRAAVARAGAALAAGDRRAAAEQFIDFWMGTGTWRSKPEAQRGAIEAATANVVGWGHALFNEATPLGAFAALTMPVLLMVGKETPASARAVVDLLARVLPKVEVMEFDGLGHMGPLTHPKVVNTAIADFLNCHAS